MERPLYDIAHSRSGDKGPNTNVGLIFNSVEAYDWAKLVVTEKRVKDQFGDGGKGEVVRYELPNLWALNFILKDSLSGGGSQTLQLDAQGKSYGQHLLRMELDIPLELI